MTFSCPHAILIVAFAACVGGTVGVCTDGQCDIRSNTVGVSDDEVAMLQIKMTNARQTDAAAANITANITGVSVEGVEGIDGYEKFTGDCAGNDLSVLGNKSADECADMCTCDDSCKGFSYLPGSWEFRCVHKSGSCSAATENGWTFYFKRSVTKKASMSCKSKTTPKNSDGKVVKSFQTDIEPSVTYLDRHNLDCGSGTSGLKRIKLDALSSNKIEFEYTCCSVASSLLGSSRSRNTDWNSDGSGKATYLDRHNVKCGSKEFLTQVRLRTSGSKMRYDFKCQAVRTSLQDCVSKSTKSNDDGNGNPRYLDRHSLSCPSSQLMTRFRMKKDGNSKYHYDYTCCSVSKC